MTRVSARVRDILPACSQRDAMLFVAGAALGPYTILGPIGSGGMGEVYRAHDPRLGRDVAIKVLLPAAFHDAERRERLQREARAVAALNHPHICVVHDIGEQDGQGYLVMELLEGESLAERLGRGRLSLDEALQIGCTVLETLSVVHDRGLLHRDLKPANIFLTPHGVKLLDFGLARAVDTDETAARDPASITREGLVLGSPRYMAPEQLRGGRLDHRTDLFAAGVVLFEMVSGASPFGGLSPIEVAHAIIHDEPAPLPEGIPRALQRVLRQALEKDPARRPSSARAFAAALRADDDAPTGAGEMPASGPVRRATRLIVVPFRLLRPDPEIDFLAYSLADAVASSLAGLDSLVVRSSLGVVQPTGTLDLRTLAAQADVDVALTGSLLRVGSQVRVAAQLVEVPNGSITWSHTMQAPVEDLFQLQDLLANAIVSSLHVPLTRSEQRGLRRDVPGSAEAYELYLRANGLMAEAGQWSAARALYERAVGLDPGYAPAWARLGRVLRVMAKYGGADSGSDLLLRAERAFERALALNPDLPMAHHLYTYLEVELGRASDALARLLARARSRRPDADLFAGLVTTCRYCGLLEESVAAWEQARRVDAAVRTSVSYSFYLLGEFARAIETDLDLHSYPSLMARYRLGDREAALAGLQALERDAQYITARLIAGAYRAALTGTLEDAIAAKQQLEASTFSDPEGYFFLGIVLAGAAYAAPALSALERAVTGGFHCAPAMRRDPLFASIADTSSFARLLDIAEAGQAAARETFEEAGGPELLGV
jgi:eukaryotic-like serine/threonine-protein kinase